MAVGHDYIILGSGIAGLNTALLAREHGSVVILTKGDIDDCNTRFAQGGIAAAVGEEDSPDLHMKDTVAAGAGLCDAEAVRVLVNEGPGRIADLIHRGVPFDTIHGEIALAKEGAHSVPRILHAGGDATGQHIETTLAQAVRDAGIQVLEHTLATRVVVEQGSSVCVEAWNTQTGQQDSFPGRYIVLATGGAGRLYHNTTNPEVATGDGVALAFRAGAEVMDMEFYQFHPTALRMDGVPTFLISEAMRGEGAVLRNAAGQPFMADYHPLGDLASRDVVARAIFREMDRSSADQVFLDVTHLDSEAVRNRFPTIYRFCLDHSLDITTSPIPVAPAAHYMMGGIKTNTWGETSINGLYATGEVACTGVHGANRLASNSLLDTSVFARRVVERTLGWGGGEKGARREEMAVPLLHREMPASEVPTLSLTALQDLMSYNVGMVRNAEGLGRAAAVLESWDRTMPVAKNRPSHELANMVLLGRLITEAALKRRESRGAHFREDYPDSSSDWLKHIVTAQSQ